MNETLDPADTDPGLSAQQRKELRDQLLADAARAVEQEAALAASYDAAVAAADAIEADDEHDSEDTTVAFERAQLAALHRQAQADRVAIDRALERLDDPSFGVCDQCAEPIGAARLQALPATTRCVSCA